ncbi:MAG: NB-ARC domain-containing protein [Candidatus Colwellbacteria bacterium]|nr:NB-ARC domain-containing protein [Candidatus Colwellbacteria bacterium]
MTNNSTKLNRNYGYDIIINTFETSLRRYLANEVFIINYGNDWKKYIPDGVLDELFRTKEYQMPEECSIDDFFEELTFLNLKDIIVFSNNFKLTTPFLGAISKDKFIELMDELNRHRRKIAHAKSTFSNLDLLKAIEYVELLCQGEAAKEVRLYLQNEQYKNAKDVPLDFFDEYECQNNLPPEDYDLDGGFVGREKEIRALKKLLKSDQDRIITITGAGGVGKTAIALKLAYSFLSEPQNPFDAIMWFSAKASKLTDAGIVPLVSDIRSDEQLIADILNIVDSKIAQNFKEAKVPLESYKTHLYNIFSSQKCLIIIDNLETILKDDALITFIKDIPRPSKALITSRKGLGEIERRYPITDMLENDAIQLFRIIAKERNRPDLLRLNNEIVSELVRRVKHYPLVIKWSIGQVCLGKDLDAAFSQIFAGESDIAKFSFNDIFSLLSDNSKAILFSMIVYGDKPVSRYVLTHLPNLTDDQFEDAIRELMMASFVFSENKEMESRIVTEFSMLTLTRGFIENKLDEDEKTKQMLQTRYYHLLEQIQEVEKSKSGYYQLLFSLGIKTLDEGVAFNYVKTAKEFYYQGDKDNAEKNFEQAIKIAPKFPYAIMEYSKFKFNTGHIYKALELAKKAIQADPENYHSWFSYGISLKRAQKFPEAIESLQKAKELNPKHLPIFNELGRVYTFTSDYEKAEAEFVGALTEEKHPNFRHKLMTLQFLADNYKRWAEAFVSRRDINGQIEMLNKAFETILKALEIAPKDRVIWNFYRNICIDLGLALSNKKGFAEGKPYLEKCLQNMKFGQTTIIPDSEIIAKACFYLAALSMNESDRNTAQIETYINRGLANCMVGSKYFDKLKELQSQLLQKDPSKKSVDDRKYGRIRYYNRGRKFGIIEIGNETHLFLISGFRYRLATETLYKLDGMTVSFILIKNPDREGLMLPIDIVLEEE